MRHRKTPSPLTVRQRQQKLAFCLIAGALFILIAGWGAGLVGRRVGGRRVQRPALPRLHRGWAAGRDAAVARRQRGRRVGVLPGVFLLSSSGGVKENTYKPVPITEDRADVVRMCPQPSWRPRVWPAPHKGVRRPERNRCRNGVWRIPFRCAGFDSRCRPERSPYGFKQELEGGHCDRR